jgi:hypothetical protein
MFGIKYFEDVISESDEEILVSDIREQVRSRHDQGYGDDFDYGRNCGSFSERPGLIAESIKDKFGGRGMMWNHYAAGGRLEFHWDGLPYAGNLCILSLLSERTFSLLRHPQPMKTSVNPNFDKNCRLRELDRYDFVLPPRSLIVFSDPINRNFLHGIFPGGIKNETASVVFR